MQLLLAFFIIVVSILLLGKGADWLTASLIPLARRMGVSGAAVGLILVSAAVSLPEILVASATTLQGSPTISLGVVLGSIICNIGLMTGLCAMIRPLKVKQTLILRDGIFSIIIPILVFAVGAGGEITRLEGGAFLLLFIPYVINVYLQEKRQSSSERKAEMREVAVELEFLGINIGRLKPGWFSFILGLLLLLVGAHLFSLQLVWIASHLGFDELIIGLTLGAIGPSLPNIAAAYHATKKGMGDIAVSETLGSNVFTLLVTLGITAMLAPVSLSSRWLSFEIPALIAMSFLLFLTLVTKQSVSRFEGFLLFSAYITIVAIQIYLTL